MNSFNRELYLRLLRHVRPYWRTFALSLVAMVVLALTEPALPALLKPMLDGSFVDKDLNTVNLMAVLLVVLFGVRGLSAYLSAVGLQWVAGKLVMDLRNLMFEKLVRLPPRYFDDHPAGSLISKVTFDVTLVTDASTHVLTVLVRDSLAVVGLLAWMLYLDWTLTLVALATAPVIVFTVRRLSTRLRLMSSNMQRSMGDITHVLEEAINGQKVVRVFGGQTSEIERFGRVTNRARRFLFKFSSSASINAPLAQFIIAIALAVIVYLAAHKSAANEITVGGFASFFAAMGMLFSPLKRLTAVNGPLQKGLAAADSVFALIDEPSEPDTGTRNIGRVRGEIEFHEVGFSYETSLAPALNHIDLRIHAGQTVALVGPSGSGKTTLVNLIPRFYRPNTGRILFDGMDIAEATLDSLRANIALVSQEVVLFNDTVAGNIAYGPLREAPLERIVEAARAAGALDFIEALPARFDTELGDKGVRLSGGQRQRIAIARAFLKDAPVLILDEATSSLDSIVERDIQLALERLRADRTTLVIAHRLSTIEKADMIVVMSGGRVLESGRHAELMRRSELYAGLYQTQFSTADEERPAVGVQ